MAFSRTVLVGLLVGASWLQIPPVAVAAEALSVGQEATVTGTGSAGLRVRNGPGVRQPILTLLAEGKSVQIVDGPVTASGVTWYRVRSRDLAGWVMARYLAPSATSRRTTAANTPRSFVAKITSYSTGEPGVGTRTATGTSVRYGVVSVDPTVIPLGSQLVIEGFGGQFVAEDTGSGVRGAQVDVWLPDGVPSLRFSTQYRQVTVVREGSGR